MAKLTLLFFVTLVVSFGFLDTAKSEEEEEPAQPEEAEERSAYAQAKAQAAAANRPGLFRPGPGQIRPPGPGPYPPGPGHLPPGHNPSSGSVQCYSCVDCPDAQPGQLKYCPRGLDPSKASACVTYVERYKNQNVATIRGCASERGRCADIKRVLNNLGNVKLISCHECEGDRCNGASRSLTDLTMAFMALLVTPLLAKVTLS